MKDKINRDYLLQILKELLAIPSPTGFCHDIMRRIKEEANQLGYSFEWTNKGNGILTVPGQRENFVWGMTAHVDTLGAIVRSIKDSGRIRLSPVGSYMMNSIEGEYCQIHTRDGHVYEGTILTTEPSVHVYPKAREQKREEADFEIRIDELVSSKEEVLDLGIAVGDFISFDPRTKVYSNGYIKSRHLDNKAGVAVLLGLLELFKRESITPVHPIKLLISTYEEVGHGGAHFPEEVDELLCVDMGAMGDDLSCTEQDVSICAKDSSGPYDYQMTSKLIELAKREGIPYAVDIYPQYSSDASAALRAGNNLRAALLGPGVHASHTMERTHIDALLHSCALLAAYTTESFRK